MQHTQPLQVWDGVRPMSPRHVLETSRRGIDGLELTFTTENVEHPTDWCFEGQGHTLVVHMAGQLRRMESVFRGGPSSAVLPAVGDLWTIPAGWRYAALAQGGTISFAELTLPGTVEGRLQPAVAQRDPFLFQSVLRLQALIARNDDLSSMAFDALAEAVRLHVRVTRFQSADSGSPRRGGDQFPARRFSRDESRRLRELLHDRLDAPVNAERFATALGMSKSRFHAGFKATYGTTPWQYVLRLRLQEAARLLDKTSASVTEIAIATGFASPSHFAATFTRRIGTTPTEYRRARGERDPSQVTPSSPQEFDNPR